MTRPPQLGDTRSRLARRVACAVAACALASGARATDVADWHYASPLPDATIQIGPRRLHLPPGHWTLVHRSEFEAWGANLGARASSVTAYTAWAVRIEDGEFRMAVALSLPVRRLQYLHRWGPDPCARERSLIFQRTLSSSAATPECLSIDGSLSFMQSMRSTNIPVANWFETQKFKDVDGLVHVLYTKHHNTTFGRVSVLLPTQAFESDIELIRWSNALPALLGPLIDADADDATLPEPPPTPAKP